MTNHPNRSQYQITTDAAGRICWSWKGREYRTNPEGNGLWVWDEFGKSWGQFLGTQQFSVDRTHPGRRIGQFCRGMA